MNNTITLQPHERDLWGRVYASTLERFYSRDDLACGEERDLAACEADAAVMAMREREPVQASDATTSAIPRLPEGWAVKDEGRVYGHVYGVSSDTVVVDRAEPGLYSLEIGGRVVSVRSRPWDTSASVARKMRRALRRAGL